MQIFQNSITNLWALVLSLAFYRTLCRPNRCLYVFPCVDWRLFLSEFYCRLGKWPIWGLRGQYSNKHELYFHHNWRSQNRRTDNTEGCKFWSRLLVDVASFHRNDSWFLGKGYWKWNDCFACVRIKFTVWCEEFLSADLANKHSLARV